MKRKLINPCSNTLVAAQVELTSLGSDVTRRALFSPLRTSLITRPASLHKFSL